MADFFRWFNLRLARIALLRQVSNSKSNLHVFLPAGSGAKIGHMVSRGYLYLCFSGSSFPIIVAFRPWTRKQNAIALTSYIAWGFNVILSERLGASVIVSLLQAEVKALSLRTKSSAG